MIRTYICFDLETTGLNVESDEIIEVGAVKVVEGRLTEQFTCFVNIHKPLSPFISDLTGISDAMLQREGYEKQAVIEEFVKFCDGYALLGHNLMFDYKFMKTAASLYGLPFEKSGIDTLDLARKFLPELPNKKLGSLCDHYQYRNEKAHRAVYDARATAYCYEQMIRQFGKENPDAFHGNPLFYRPKKWEPATIRQKRYLNDLLKYHKIENTTDMEQLSKSEASKLIDSIILKHGMMNR
ncbi:MAG: 3'-5' exonuclease [Clostridiales bacterium]|nr:3'-5' exonuclease [Clostridiales bacterium]